MAIPSGRNGVPRSYQCGQWRGEFNLRRQVRGVRIEANCLFVICDNRTSPCPMRRQWVHSQLSVCSGEIVPLKDSWVRLMEGEGVENIDHLDGVFKISAK